MSTVSPEATVLVFIDGPIPTEEDRALAELHGTKSFRNANENAYPVEICRCAVAVDPALVPKGYPLFTESDPEEREIQTPAPSLNPATGVQPPWKAQGSTAGPIVPTEE